MTTWKHRVWWSAVTVVAGSERLRRRWSRVVLVLGHMRSGSSLVHHLLASHQDVFGWGERNAAYRSRLDLDRLSAEIRLRYRRLGGPVPWVADQVNHSRLLADESLLEVPRVRGVILAREPRGALQSMVATLGRHYPGFGPADALDHYLERVATLARTARAARERGRPLLCLEYDRLCGAPRESLDALGSYLGLEPPLAAEYSTLPFTGRRGDPSERIRSGRILAPQRQEAHRFSAGEMELAAAAFAGLAAAGPFAGSLQNR